MSAKHSATPASETVVPPETAQRILARAIELDAEGAGMTLRELGTLAREVGVSPLALDAAIKEVGVQPARASTWFSRLKSRWRAWLRASTPTDADEVLPPTFWVSMLLNVLAISTVGIGVGVLLLALDAAGLTGQWQLRKAVDVVAVALAAAVAIKLRARFATFVLAGLGVAVFAEVALDLFYGTPVIRGAAPHFALIVAGLFGVGIGSFLATRREDDGPVLGSSRAAVEEISRSTT